jgi:hypothetical protein
VFLIGFIVRCKNFVSVLNGRRLMVNYKIVNETKMSVDVDSAPGGHDVGYIEISGDILEVNTDQIVMKSLPQRKAKEMVRHLNFGGGFDGFTPAFFLNYIDKNAFASE